MIAQMENYGVIEGLLNEIDLKRQVYGGSNVISGNLVVQVKQEIVKGEGKRTLSIPVKFYAKEFTKAGNPNPSYEGLNAVIENAHSIAVYGEEGADAIRINGATANMEEYYLMGGKLITYPSVRASFVDIISKSEMIQRATFEVECVIDKMAPVVDSEGVEVEPAELEIHGVHVGYNGYTDLIPFKVKRQDIISGITNLYQVGQTITMAGYVNFDSKQETYLEEVEIGDPIEKSRTVRVSEFVVDAVKPRGNASIDHSAEDVKAALASRIARLANKEAKVKSQTGGATRTNTVQQKKEDLGF